MTATQIVKAEPSKPNVRTRKEWATMISADWRKSIDAILATCKSLVAANDELGQTEFYDMVREDLPFSPNIAKRADPSASPACASHQPVIGDALSRSGILR